MEICLWITPKIFDDLADPVPSLDAFFDHYRDWLAGRPVTIIFCASNGDHVLCYSGERAASFDWARYNCFAAGVPPRVHNLDWLQRVRDGGERSFNPYSAGPMFTVSEQPMDYQILAGIYAAIRTVAARRRIDIVLLEYLEPGPEFCRSEWKTQRHPEVAASGTDAGGHVVPGVIDVTLPLAGDSHRYAAYPGGIPAGLPAGDFVAAQTAAFTEDFGLDGVMLGNQFGLVGFWDPGNAPPVTAERTAGIDRFFTRLRSELGSRLVYWMDTYWRTEVEQAAWGMPASAYQAMDAILVSTFAVLVERTEIVPNLRSKAALRSGDPSRADGNGPRVLFGLDFVDPWYWYRTYLDDRRTYLFQREALEQQANLIDGVSFFANDTFGHFIPAGPLTETLRSVTKAQEQR